MTPTSSAADAARGRPVPWIIAAFFVSFIIPLLCFAWIAFYNKPSEVTPHAYDKGLQYNRTLAKGAAEAALGWKATLSMQGRMLVAVLVDSKEQPIRGAEVRAWFLRPSEATMDRKAVMQEVSPGRYEASLGDAAPGLWEARITAKLSSDQFQAARSFSVAP